MTTLVVGGGITGLAAATRLQARDEPVLLVEASDRLGGKIETERCDGYLVEWGPHSIVSTGTELFAMAEELGLGSAIIPAQPEAERRYLWWRGRLVPTPRGPGSFFRTPLLSWGAKFRVLREWFHWSTGAPDESAAAFVARRFGPQVADRFLAPFVSGIYAGDAERLEAASAFPRLPKWEAECGSVIKGLVQKGRQRKESEASGDRPSESTAAGSKSGSESRPRGTYGFRGGMQTVVDAAATRLGGSARVNSPVRAIRRAGARFEVDVDFDGAVQSLDVDRVIITTPAFATADLVDELAPGAVEPLRAIPYAPVGLLELGVKRSSVSRPLDGFGFLTVPSESPALLGCIWASTVFPDRAPDGHALFSVFVGGARTPAGADPDQLAREAERTLFEILGSDLDPVWRSFRWIPRGIPQLTIGHSERVGLIRTAVDAVPGLDLAGGYLDGVSIHDCVRSGWRAAEVATHDSASG